jgi:hypothetical protein
MQLKGETMKNIKYLGLGFVLALSIIVLNSVAAAQTSSSTPDQSSLGDYARKVRKDPAAKAKPKVFDNDNLPTNDKLSVVGPAPTADASTTPAAADAKDKDAAAKPASAADDEQAKKKALAKGWQDKISSQKDAIDLASRELDVTQREYQLRAAAMYADVGNRMRNATQWDKEEADYKQKIADKQKALDDAKQKLEDMKEDARKAGVPSAMID